MCRGRGRILFVDFGVTGCIQELKFAVWRTRIIKQRIINVSILVVVAVYSLFCASLVILLILPITDVIEEAITEDSYSNVPKVICSRKFETWTDQEIDSGSNQSALDSLMPFSPVLNLREAPPTICDGVFDDRVITIGQPKLLLKWTMSDALMIVLWPFWWVFVLGFLASWISIYVIFGLRAINPVSIIMATLNKITADEDENSA